MGLMVTQDSDMPNSTEAAHTEAWDALNAELDQWHAQGRIATFWWRDDDASRPGPQLSRLLSLSAKTGTPVVLASIPATADVAFADTVLAHPTAYVAQHGYAHINHAKGSGDKGAWELGRHRQLETVLDELQQGRRVLAELFGPDRFLPVMVPPWNRIDPSVVAELPALGYTALSLCDARPAAEAAPGLRLVNSHCDPIKWKGGARFTGTAKSISFLTDHLIARRTGSADAAEPTGLLTHHIDHDAATWDFCETLLGHLTAHPAVRFPAPSEVFAS